MRCRWPGPLLALAALFVLCAAPARAYWWQRDYVDPYGLVGTDASLVLSGGNRYVAYTAGGLLYLATNTGPGWSYDAVAVVGFGGGWCSASAGPSGPPAIAFINDTPATPTVCYASKASGSWVIETVESVGWLAEYVSLKFDKAGAPAIAYTTSPGPGSQAAVRLARRTGPNSWNKETVATIGDVTGPDLAFDSASLPALSFVDFTSGSVKYAKKNASGAWIVESVAGTSSLPANWYTSLAFSGGSTPCIAYFLETGGMYLNLAYSSKSMLGWSRESVKSLPSGVLQFCSLAVDDTGRPSIAFFNSLAQTLGYARRLSSGWVTETVDDGYMAGYRPSMTLDAEGRPEIAYVDTFFSAVKHAMVIPSGLDAVKAQPDGSLVSFVGAVASTAAGEMAGKVYVQAADRSSGIQLYLGAQSPPAVSRGAIVKVEGQTGTRNGERCVLSPEITITASGDAPVPLRLSNAALGGEGFFYDPAPPAIGQQGVDGAAGLNNIGLLVRTVGKVTSVGSGYLYIEDGSALSDGTSTDGVPNAGVRVLTAAGGYHAGQYLSVTGISSCFFNDSGLLHRQIVPRNAADLVQLVE